MESSVCKHSGKSRLGPSKQIMKSHQMVPWLGLPGKADWFRYNRNYIFEASRNKITGFCTTGTTFWDFPEQEQEASGYGCFIEYCIIFRFFRKWKHTETIQFKAMLKLFKLSVCKGQCHKIFDFRFFHESVSPQAPDYTIRVVSNFFKIRSNICSSRCTTGVIDTSENGKNLQSLKF